MEHIDYLDALAEPEPEPKIVTVDTRASKAAAARASKAPRRKRAHGVIRPRPALELAQGLEGAAQLAGGHQGLEDLLAGGRARARPRAGPGHGRGARARPGPRLLWPGGG